MISLIIALIALMVFGSVLICVCIMVMQGTKEGRLREDWCNHIMENESYTSYSEFLKHRDKKAWVKHLIENEESK